MLNQILAGFYERDLRIFEKLKWQPGIAYRRWTEPPGGRHACPLIPMIKKTLPDLGQVNYLRRALE